MVEEKEVEVLEENSSSEPKQGKGLSIAALILGICSIVLMKFFFITLGCGILAIIFGFKGRKREGKGMAAAGFITGIIGVSLQVLFFLFGFIIGLAMAGSMFSAL